MFSVPIGWDSNRHGSANPSTRIIIFFTWNLLPIRSPLCLTRDDSNPNQFIFIDVCFSFRLVFSSYSSITSSLYLIESIERRRRATSILMRAKKKGESNTFVKRNGERGKRVDDEMSKKREREREKRKSIWSMLKKTICDRKKVSREMIGNENRQSERERDKVASHSLFSPFCRF